MKRLLLSLFFLCLFNNIIAQHNPSFIGLQAGTSLPVGKFHSKKLPDGGFAQAGLSVSLEGAWFFKPWMGLGGNAGLNLHPVDVTSLGYEKTLSDPFINNVTVRSEPYFSTSVYAGLYFDIPLVQKLSLTAKALGGIIYAQTPYQLYKIDYYMIGINWSEVTSAGDYEGSFLAGAGFRYDLNDYIGLALNSEFTFNQCEFDFMTLDGSIRTDQKVISFVNVTAGIVIKI
jgi:hypothetical protein